MPSEPTFGELTVDDLRELAEVWENAATEYYYEHRHTHEAGIGWVGGYEAGWDHAAALLRELADTLEGKSHAV